MFKRAFRVGGKHNKPWHVFSMLTMFDNNFLESAWEFNGEVTWRKDVLNSIQKITVLSRILVNYFCIYCSNFEPNPSE